MLLQRFFVPEVPAGYQPGSLLAQIAKRDLPGMMCSVGTPEATIDLQSSRIDVRERVKRVFFQHTTMTVYGLGRPKGTARAFAQHTGEFRRTGIRFKGDGVLVGRLDRTDVTDVLTPLDFTRLSISGMPGAFRVEIETYGGAEVVLRSPRVRRYVPMGQDQSTLLLEAFRVIAAALSNERPPNPEGGHA